MESKGSIEFTVIVHENGEAEIINKTREGSKEEKIIVENNLFAPITIVVKKINETEYKGYEIQIYDRTKHKDLDGSYLVTATEALVITNET